METSLPFNFMTHPQKTRPDIDEESSDSSDEEDLTDRQISIKQDKKKATDNKGIANRLSMFRRRTLSVTLKNSIFFPNY